MQSRWNDADAAAARDLWGAHGEDLALRVYTSRLIGTDDSLVLHGGGNTSVKTTVVDALGDRREVVCVKGSGWDLARIEPEGLPAVDLAGLRRMRSVDALSDEEMVNQIRTRLLRADAPTPSVETLLHAFLPHKFVDHTHADAICVLTNQPDGRRLVAEALGDDVVVLEWIFPGFPLAHAVAAAHEANPSAIGIVLEKHGIFTFADDARESYERMIALVDRAERFLAERAQRMGRRSMLLPTSSLPTDEEARLMAMRCAPVVRGAVAMVSHPPNHPTKVHHRFVMNWRGAEDLRAFTAHADCRRLAALGPLTPDHVIRTKSTYLVLGAEEACDPARVRKAVLDYEASYVRYVRAHGPAGQVMLDPMPRVVLVEGVGVFAFGVNAGAASVAADIAEHTLRGKALGAAIGEYTELDPAEVYKMEYWPLELAKLGKKKTPPLGGQVGLVTGAAGAIGFGIAQALLDAGAEVMVTDLNEDALARIHNKLIDRYGARRVAAAAMDVSDPHAVERGFAAACLAFGGVDVVVPNAGVAHVSRLGDMDPTEFERVVRVNLIGTMNVLREATRVFRQQGTGGAVVVQASKNVFDPGAGFGAYSASKAAAHQLGKIAALELAELGVTVNMVNADAVFGDDEVPSGLWEEVGPDRMRARGLDPQGLRDYYRERSLLKREVTPQHVGAAVVFFASGATPTTGATLPVDGGVPGAFPR